MIVCTIEIKNTIPLSIHLTTSVPNSLIDQKSLLNVASLMLTTPMHVGGQVPQNLAVPTVPIPHSRIIAHTLGRVK
jgi:hypothetical protein